MRIPGRGYTTKLLCKKIAIHKRNQFSKLCRSGNINGSNENKLRLQCDIISVSGTKNFEEQILSLLSFVQNVGEPSSWLLYSDGTYSDEDLKMLGKIFPFITIKIWNELPNRFPEYDKVLHDYTTKHGIGKKTYVIINHHLGKPFLYFDSDLVFYKKMREYLHLFENSKYSYFSVDNDWCCLDPDYMSSKKQDMYQLNSGVLYLNPDINWLPALDYLSKIDGDYRFYDQTAIHNAIFSDENNNCMPFDPRVFKVETSDHFRFRMASTTRNLAVRHYVGPLRHKMWQKGYKWHLKS